MASKLPDGTPLNVGVYKAYRNAGLSHNQALAITAEVGRENGFRANILFGYHEDPAPDESGKKLINIGMLSWNRSRAHKAKKYLQKMGVMRNGKMQQNQATLNAQAAFSVGEMKSPAYAKKLKTFWSNPNANPDTFARELGKKYIVWAYGQDTIRAKGGGRKPFDWQWHDNRRRNYMTGLAKALGDNTDYQATGQSARQPVQFKRPPKMPLSQIQPIAFERPKMMTLEEIQSMAPEAITVPDELLKPIQVETAFQRPEKVPLSSLNLPDVSLDELTDRQPVQFERPPKVSIDSLQPQDEQAQTDPEPQPFQLPEPLTIKETRIIRQNNG